MSSYVLRWQVIQMIKKDNLVLIMIERLHKTMKYDIDRRLDDFFGKLKS
jgi:hypothetical protein